MKSIREVFKIGRGPSSSHTMGPEKAVKLFKSEHPDAASYKVILYGSLAEELFSKALNPPHAKSYGTQTTS